MNATLVRGMEALVRRDDGRLRPSRRKRYSKPSSLALDTACVRLCASSLR
jgi:hypothetical protein